VLVLIRAIKKKKYLRNESEFKIFAKIVNIFLDENGDIDKSSKKIRNTGIIWKK
jgi:ribosome-binding protein aMBF1 (putative translation factor)